MPRSESYEDLRDFLLGYARDDWLMLSVVVDWSGAVVGDDALHRDVADVAMRLASDLINDGSPPGDLVADDRDFVPWPGDADARWERLRRELFAMVDTGELPLPGDICWFHQVGTD